MASWNAPERTLLLVGEGAHEVAFLRHVKNIFAPRGCGLGITIKNARGKGALHVINWTVKQIQNAAYDACATLLDTDTDFTPVVVKIANDHEIQLLKSEPCLETMLLQMLGIKKIAHGRDKLKDQILPFVNGDPTISEHYAQHFTKELLIKARKKHPTIDELLRLFE